MRVDQPQLRNEPFDCTESTVARVLAPEEISVGDYVTLMNITWEAPSFFWCADTSLLPPDEMVRLQIIPEESGVPLRVKSVCLPFVLAKSPEGDRRTLDVRCCRLARLNAEFGAESWKAYRANRRLQKRKRRRRKRLR